MEKPKSKFLKALFRRGDFHESNNIALLDELAINNKLIGYIGFDATAPSLHVGNLMQILKLRIMQHTGQKPIVLIGGGTTRIGDPSGKDEMRKIRDDNEIKENIDKIKTILSKFIIFGDGPNEAILVNNSDWLDKLNYISFLRDIGKFFTINRMLTYESVKNRLDRSQPLSFIEFNYMILQAFDFLKLNQDFSCNLQMGGSDQWGNILNGIELCRRYSAKEVFGITSELLTTSSGAKMGKTSKGAVWLSDNLLSPYEYWNFWRNTEDPDVIRFLKIFTDIPDKEINSININKIDEINEAKKLLATEATSMCHGRSNALEAEKTAKQTFDTGLYGNSLPTLNLNYSDLNGGITVFDLFKRAFNLSSGSEARRIIREGSAKINGLKVNNETNFIKNSDFDSNNTLKLSIGKKKHSIVKKN
ncbi:MAG: Tyrosine--tRNA ligase [Alphaproteobacteria bacterium MarineAlpha2_Bin1]|nr:MAG: Tyrosine--tRNA ligase [Alphaproteobacteria bacterium MarineAlpha2_Bin1]|tara:strand:+ start:942 stop:2195 length:1254 start_codon:yes stop_codon:yes gene_type:complete